jgi:hypothetical protein
MRNKTMANISGQLTIAGKNIYISSPDPTKAEIRVLSNLRAEDKSSIHVQLSDAEGNQYTIDWAAGDARADFQPMAV